ncbi:MAG: tRNA (guanosine(37)-N1)-methyltransferase TrmD [Candidatus Omnitrophica bacterium 4484_49]|nr:MAG: tRNA (guanosine(37)-N1)-methyltransferase TrmD [Candidatus Omnitrophica bacterium 4484_49]
MLSESILKRAQEKGLVEINLHYLRKWTEDKRGTVDDRPFGGGPGMVLKLEPIYKALQELQGEDSFVILMGPQGKRLEQRLAIELASKSHLIIISGHYEGVDERVRENLIDMEVSIGDYILTCGELPAMVLIDCVVRLIPGVLGNEYANEFESFQNYLLEYPQYTRPAEFNNWRVPEVLLSGDHKKIERWRYAMAIKRTKKLRPDLYRRFLELRKKGGIKNG